MIISAYVVLGEFGSAVIAVLRNETFVKQRARLSDGVPQALQRCEKGQVRNIHLCLSFTTM